MKFSGTQKYYVGIITLVTLLSVILGVFLYTQYVHFEHGKWLEADRVHIVTDSDYHELGIYEVFPKGSTYDVIRYDGEHVSAASIYKLVFFKGDKTMGELTCYQLDPRRFNRDSTIIVEAGYRYYFDEYFYDVLWSLLK